MTIELGQRAVLYLLLMVSLVSLVTFMSVDSLLFSPAVLIGLVAMMSSVIREGCLLIEEDGGRYVDDEIQQWTRE